MAMNEAQLRSEVLVPLFTAMGFNDSTGAIEPPPSELVYVLTRHWAGAKWETLTIPRGKSEEYTARMMERNSQDASRKP